MTIAIAARFGSALADAPGQSLWKITARPVSDSYGLGEPIFFDLQVTNLGSEPASVDLGGNGKTNLRVTITEPNGLSKPVQLSFGGLQTLGKHVIGAHATFTERLVLNEWSEFREAGDYYAKIALVPFGAKADGAPTADLHVSIGPRNESRLSTVAKALADRAIKGRSVSNRGEAAFALSYVVDPVAVPEMARVLASGSDAGLSLIEALGRLGGPSAINALQAAQGNPAPWIRNAAAATVRALREGKSLARSQATD